MIKLVAPTPQEFQQQTKNYTEPALIEKMAIPNWTLETLRERVGSHKITLFYDDGSGDWLLKNIQKEIELSAYLNELQDGNETKLDFYASWMLWQSLPELHQDVPVPDILQFAAQKDWNFHHALWMGKGNKSRLHFDFRYNLSVQIWGEKEWVLYPPGNPSDFYANFAPDKPIFSDILDPQDADPVRFPRFQKLIPIRVLLKRGEALYVPITWWHFVRCGNTPTLTLSFYWKGPRWKLGLLPYYRHYVKNYYLQSLGKKLRIISS